MWLIYLMQVSLHSLTLHSMSRHHRSVANRLGSDYSPPFITCETTSVVTAGFSLGLSAGKTLVGWIRYNKETPR